MYSLASTASHLVVGGRDLLQGWDWASLGKGGTTLPSWEISLPGRGEVNCMALLADEGMEDRLVLGMGDNNLHLVDLVVGLVENATHIDDNGKIIKIGDVKSIDAKDGQDQDDTVETNLEMTVEDASNLLKDFLSHDKNHDRRINLEEFRGIHVLQKVYNKLYIQ